MNAHRKSRLLGVVVLLAAVLLPTLSPSRALAGDTEGARLFREARKLMVEERFAEACPKLRESNRLEPHVGTLLNLAACDERLGKVATAWVEYQQALTSAHAEGQLDRENLARERLSVLEPRVSWFVLDVPSGEQDLTVTLDGGALAPAAWGKDMPLDPGSHVAAATAAGKERWEQPFELREGERKVLDVRLLDLPAAPKEAVVVPPASPAPASESTLQIQTRFHTERRLRKGLAIGGATLFLTTYAVSALAAGIITAGCSGMGCDDQMLWTLFVPGLGPFAAMASPGNSTYTNFVLAADAVAQGAGIAMFIVGMTVRHDVLVPDEPASRHGLQLNLVPYAGAGRAGLGVVGTF